MKQLLALTALAVSLLFAPAASAMLENEGSGAGGFPPCDDWHTGQTFNYGGNTYACTFGTYGDYWRVL